MVHLLTRAYSGIKKNSENSQLTEANPNSGLLPLYPDWEKEKHLAVNLPRGGAISSPSVSYELYHPAYLAFL